MNGPTVTLKKVRLLGAPHPDGRSEKLGNDFLIRAFIYDDISGERRAQPYSFHGDPSKLITKAFVVRTKEAIIRSLVPGLVSSITPQASGGATGADDLAGLVGAVYGGLEALNTAAERIRTNLGKSIRNSVPITQTES